VTASFGETTSVRSGDRLWLALVLVLATAGPVAAQDLGFDALLFAGVFDSAVDDVQARAAQLYRLPMALSLRSPADGRVGVRLTFPVSLTSVRVETISDVKPFIRKLGVAAIVPGIELLIPVSDRVRLRPFAEAGIGKGTDGGRTEVLYGAGIRARVDQPVRRLQVTFGGSAMHRKRGTGGGEYGGHSMFEAAVDSQLPLGFSVGSRQARGGLYVIARGFHGLELPRAGQDPIVLRSQFEAGVSFSTSPDLNVWKVRLPWIAVGYQFGQILSGVRIYVWFPF
jgi:hypothetical protein